MGRLDGKVAAVTGAASGFGKLSAELFAKEGAKVVVADFSEEGKDVVKSIIDEGGEAAYVQCDVSNASDCKRMVKATVDAFGKIDIMYNNAGINGGIGKDFSHYSIEAFERPLKSI